MTKTNDKIGIQNGWIGVERAETMAERLELVEIAGIFLNFPPFLCFQTKGYVIKKGIWYFRDIKFVSSKTLKNKV